MPKPVVAIESGTASTNVRAAAIGPRPGHWSRSDQSDHTAATAALTSSAIATPPMPSASTVTAPMTSTTLATHSSTRVAPTASILRAPCSAPTCTEPSASSTMVTPASRVGTGPTPGRSAPVGSWMATKATARMRPRPTLPTSAARNVAAVSPLLAATALASAHGKPAASTEVARRSRAIRVPTTPNSSAGSSHARARPSP